jgi:hypothetical protein
MSSNRLDEVDFLYLRAEETADSNSIADIERSNSYRLLAGFIGLRELVKNAQNQETAAEADSIRWALVNETRPIKLSLAAEILDISIPTARAWAKQGVLEELSTSPQRVTLSSVAQIFEILLKLDKSQHKTDLLAAVLAEIERQELIKDERFRESLKQMQQGIRASS